MFQKKIFIAALVIPLYSSFSHADSHQNVDPSYWLDNKPIASSVLQASSPNYRPTSYWLDNKPIRPNASKQYNDIVDSYNAMGRFIAHEDRGCLNVNTPGFMDARNKAEEAIRRFNPSAPAFGYGTKPSARSIRQQMWGTMKDAHDAAKGAVDKNNDSCSENNASKQYDDIADAYNAMGTFIPDEDGGRLNVNTPGFMDARNKAEGAIRRFNPSAPAFGYGTKPSARSIRQQMWGTMKDAHDAAKRAGDKSDSCSANKGETASHKAPTKEETPTQVQVSVVEKNPGLLTKIALYLLDGMKTIGNLDKSADVSGAQSLKQPSGKYLYFSDNKVQHKKRQG